MSRYDRALGRKRETVTREMIRKAAGETEAADRSLGTTVNFSVSTGQPSPGREIVAVRVFSEYFDLDRDIKLSLLGRLGEWIDNQRKTIGDRYDLGDLDLNDVLNNI